MPPRAKQAARRARQSAQPAQLRAGDTLIVSEFPDQAPLTVVMVNSQTIVVDHPELGRSEISTANMARNLANGIVRLVRPRAPRLG